MAKLNQGYLFTWKIENFSLCELQNKEKLQSPAFKAESIGGSEWQLSLYPKGHFPIDDDFVSLFLSRVNYDTEITEYKVEMSGFDGEILKSLEKKHVSFDNTEEGWPKFISRDIVIDKIQEWKKDILTIRCHLKNHSKSTTDSVCGSEVWTKIGCDHCCFQWSVKLLDFSTIRSEKAVFIRKRNQFLFILHDNDRNDDIDIYVGNYAGISSETKVIACKISLINMNRTTRVESKKNICELKDNFIFLKSFSKNILRELLMGDNVFTLKVDFSASTGEIWSELKNVKYEDPSLAILDDTLSALQDDLRRTFETKKNSDVELRVGGLIIPAHKYILCARSPVFSAMFDQNMTEGQTRIVDITDIDFETMDTFLKFLYTGSMSELKFENAKKLLIAADKYQVSSLAGKCLVLIRSELSVTNVCDVYAIGDMIGNELLKSSAYEFIAENSATVFASDIWSDWMKENVGLANEILFKMVNS